VFERLRAALNAALDAAMPPPDPRDIAAQMRLAIVEARTSLEAMQQGIIVLDRELAAERKALADAERRGRLAANIDDAETVAVAERFAVKHRERVEVLERKLAAQRAELELAEREVQEMKSQYREYEQSRPATDAARSVNAAWRDLEAAGLKRPTATPDEEILRSRMDRAAREAEAEAQLEALKRKMGRG
jgi:hypothetical protein